MEFAVANEAPMAWGRPRLTVAEVLLHILTCCALGTLVGGIGWWTGIWWRIWTYSLPADVVFVLGCTASGWWALALAHEGRRSASRLAAFAGTWATFAVCLVLVEYAGGFPFAPPAGWRGGAESMLGSLGMALFFGLPALYIATRMPEWWLKRRADG